MKNIVLTGFMGSGKTAVGRILAEKLDVEFVDMDDLIEKEQKMSISEIFSRFGEKRFRELEKEMAGRASQGKSQVIATGGGVVLSSENMANLKKDGIIIWLAVSPEAVLRRTHSDESRPLLHVSLPGKKIRELLEFREPFYSKADFKIETSDCSVDGVVEQILNLLRPQTKS
jgi:shikimate kinase